MNKTFDESLTDAVRDGQPLRERVQQLVSELFQSGQESVQAAGVVLQRGLQSAVDLARESLPERRDSVLRELFEGTAAGLESVAQTARYTMEEASARGRRFAAEDVQRLRSDVEGIGGILKDSRRWFSERLTADLGNAATELRTHAERATDAAMPGIRSAAEGVLRHPLQTATEAAETAIRGSRLTLSAVLRTAGSLLSGAADRLRPGGDDGQRQESGGQVGGNGP
ncbi:MAG: hypothetical protein ACKOEO_17580 [Planctomycetaceae bacterium]